MTAVEDLEQRLQRAEVRFKSLSVLCASIAILSLIISGWLVLDRRDLHVQRITIVDSAGHPRILIGAPPSIEGRMRKDAQTASIVVLGPDGADRLVLGESPNPIIQGRVYPRIASSYGLLLHDITGSERGGVSFLDNGRGVISLDRPGQDAVEMVVNDKTGFAGLTVNYQRPIGEYVEGVRIGTKGDTAWWALSDAKEQERAAIRVRGVEKPDLELKPLTVLR
jgi:hypothetical protein